MLAVNAFSSSVPPSYAQVQKFEDENYLFSLYDRCLVDDPDYAKYIGDNLTYFLARLAIFDLLDHPPANLPHFVEASTEIHALQEEFSQFSIVNQIHVKYRLITAPVEVGLSSSVHVEDCIARAQKLVLTLTFENQDFIDAAAAAKRSIDSIR